MDPNQILQLSNRNSQLMLSVSTASDRDTKKVRDSPEPRKFETVSTHILRMGGTRAVQTASARRNPGGHCRWMYAKSKEDPEYRQKGTGCCTVQPSK